MNILKKFVIKDLSLNKKRTIVTIIGIMLSSALICAVAGMVTSFQKTLVEYAKQEYGDFHTIIYDIQKEDLGKIKQNEEIEKVLEYEYKGYSNLEASKNEYKPYICLVGMEKELLNNLKLVEGRLPENEDEIVISKHIKTNGGIDLKIGETIKLEVSERISDGYKLNQRTIFTEDKEEILNKIYDKEYKIVGIIERPSTFIEDRQSPGYTVVTLDNKEKTNTSIFIKFKDSKDYKEKTKTILADIENEYECDYNISLLRWEGAALSDSTMSMLYSVSGVVIVIIIVSSIFVIKNSFSISITEKIKQYGILSSIGATSKQIKKNVLFEGFVLGIIGIPLGVICGMFAVFVLIHLMNYILAEALDGIKFMYSVPYLPILITILFSTITIYFSSIFSARKAAKTSPIEAIRNNDEIKIKSKKLKGSKLIKTIFKVGGDISYKNLKRNKRKYRTTVISLVVSITIFISLSSFIDFGFKMANEYYKNKKFNFALYGGPEKNKDTEELFNQIAKSEKINDYSIHKTIQVSVLPEYLSDFGKEYFQDSEDIEERVIAIGEKQFNDFVKQIGEDPKKYENKGILLDNFTYFKDEKKINGNLYNIENNKLTLNLLDENYEKTNKIFDIQIEKRTEEAPMGLEESTGIIISDKMMEKFDYKVNRMYIMSNDTTGLREELSSLKISNPAYEKIGYSDYEEAQRSEQAMVLVVSIFLYGFIAVISLIGVTNIFNTITTNMNLRQKEFAMLKSIGMTQNEFDRMIRLESIFYGIKSLVIGIPLGCIGSYFIYKAFSEGMEMAYKLPITAIIIATLFVFLIIGLIMKYSLNKINKQNIIDTIRNENI